MGTYAEDEKERLRLLRKHFADKQYLDCTEVIAEAAPDAAVAYLLGPAVAAVSAGAGAAVGAGVGAVAFGPMGLVVGGAAGGAVGTYWGLRAAEEIEHSYRSASTEDRARMRRLGGKGAGVAYAAWKFGRIAVKFIR